MGLGALVAGLNCESVEPITPKDTVLAMKVIQAKLHIQTQHKFGVTRLGRFQCGSLQSHYGGLYSLRPQLSIQEM